MSQTQRTSGRPATARPQAATQRRPGAGPVKRKPRRKSPLRRALTIGGVSAGILTTLCLIIVGAIYFRLQQGPISLQPLVKSIEQGISADLGGINASIEDAQMVLGENGIEFRLTSLELREADGDLVASAPLASAAVSTTDLFWLRVTPKRVFLIEPRVYLFYSDEGGLALAFSPAKDADADPAIVAPAPVPAKRPNASVIAKTTQSAPSERIDLARKLIDLNERAQRGLFASAKLREIGLKDASAVLVFAGQSSEWKIPNFVIDLDRSKTGSSITGSGSINSGQGDWSFGFKTEEAHADNAVKLRLEVADLVPSSLADAVPRLSLLKTLSTRVAGNGTLELAATGDVTAAKVDMTVGDGNIYLPNVARPLHLDSGKIGVSFDGKTKSLTIVPSTLKWGQSFVTLTGQAVQSGNEQTGDTTWAYQLTSKEGALAAPDLNVSAMPIDAVDIKGTVTPKTGRIAVEQAVLRSGGGEMTLNGEITSGSSGSNTRIEGAISNLKLDTVKSMWPVAFADGARKWVGTKMTGDVTSGTLRIVSGDFMTQGDTAEPGTTQRTTYALEAANLKANVLEGVAPLAAPRALIRGENGTVELNIPDAELPAGPKGAVQIKNAKLTATDLGTIMPMGNLTFRILSPVSSAIELARSTPEGPLAGVDLPVEGIDGKIDGQISVNLPLIETLQKQDVKVSGKVRIADLKAKPKSAKVELQGGTINIDLTETNAEAKGELIVNGVVAKVAWQHVLDVPEGMQSPVKITATLDNSDRTQLGLDLNHMVQGDVPIEVTLLRQPQGDTAVHLKADLTAAELIIEDVAWTKPPDKACTLDLDVGKMRPDGRVDLQNIKIIGDDVAIEGSAILDPDNEMRDFTFPRFSLGLISRLEVTGKQNAKSRIWQIKAKGPAYDGKSFIDSLFSLGRSAGSRVKALRPADGTDVEAEIDTVFGYQQSALKNLKVKMSTRKEKVVALDVTANLEGDRTFKAVVASAKSPRTMLAESNDAGRMFKVIGFYPNAQNGNLRVEVDLDGSGPAEKTGTLVVENFQILGEPVFNELASSGQGQQRIQREVIDFDRMRIPFSVGHGQFVLSESYLRGPVMGMTLRGKIDYKMSRVNLGGTYIPLQGVNAAICDLPIFGQIVAGANCEGVLGITFALQGDNKNPEVIVNPLSLVAPGIFRDIFQMTSPNPKIQARDDEKPAAPAEKRTRSSSSGASSGSAAGRKNAKEDAVDGWSSSDSVDPNTRKR